jgi:hypothetical protein
MVLIWFPIRRCHLDCHLVYHQGFLLACYLGCHFVCNPNFHLGFLTAKLSIQYFHLKCQKRGFFWLCVMPSGFVIWCCNLGFHFCYLFIWVVWDVIWFSAVRSCGLSSFFLGCHMGCHLLLSYWWPYGFSLMLSS